MFIKTRDCKPGLDGGYDFSHRPETIEAFSYRRAVLSRHGKITAYVVMLLPARLLKAMLTSLPWAEDLRRSIFLSWI